MMGKTRKTVEALIWGVIVVVVVFFAAWCSGCAAKADINTGGKVTVTPTLNPTVKGDGNTVYNVSVASAGRGIAECVVFLLLLGSLRRGAVAVRALDRTIRAIPRQGEAEVKRWGSVEKAIKADVRMCGYAGEGCHDAAERFIRKRINKVNGG